MKVRELIALLKDCDQDAEVNLLNMLGSNSSDGECNSIANIDSRECNGSQFVMISYLGK